MSLSYAFHIFGITFWIGGLLVFSRVMKVFIARKDGTEITPDNPLSIDLKKICWVIWIGMVLPGFFIVLLSGLYQLSSIGVAYYMKQGWFHGKSTALLCLMSITMLAGQQIIAVKNGRNASRAMLGVIHGGTAAMVLIVLLLTYLGRG